MQQLFLEIDRMRGNNRLFLLLEGIKNGRRQVGNRFAHTGPSLDHEMPFFFERPRHRHGHGLLLGPVFEIVRLRKQTALGKNRANSFDKIAPQIFLKRDHCKALSLNRKLKFKIHKSREAARPLHPA